MKISNHHTETGSSIPLLVLIGLNLFFALPAYCLSQKPDSEPVVPVDNDKDALSLHHEDQFVANPQKSSSLSFGQLSFDMHEQEDDNAISLDESDSNLRFTIDLSSRISIYADSNDVALENFIGFDMHKVFTGPDGDWGTLLLQGYLTRLDNQTHHPHFFESEDDWEFVHRIFNLNYTGLAGGRFNVRLGHFEIPYGLEHYLNTNGTLRNFIHGRNLGVKADWGVSINGDLPKLNYEFSLTRGTGNEWSSRGDPYVFAGRIGSQLDSNLVFGVSGFYGEVSTPPLPTDTVQRTRFGADLQWYTGPWSLLGEFSVGRDEQDGIVNALAEIDWHNPEESLLVYLQGRAFTRDFSTGWDDAFSTALGIRLAPDTHWAYSVQWTQDITTFGSAPRDSVLSFQIRYRF